MSTLAEIRANVQANLPSGYHSDTLTTAKIDEFINGAIPQICGVHSFWWMKREVTQSTVQSQQRYGLPDGTATDSNGVAVWRWKQGINIDLVDYESHRHILTRRIKGSIEADPAYEDTTEDGIPCDYCEDHDDLWLYPIPDHAENNNTAFVINAEYWGYPPNLSSTVTHNTLSDRWPEALEYWATARCFRHGMDYNEAEYWEGKFNEKLAIMIQEDVDREMAGIEEGLSPTAGACAGGGGQEDQVQSIGGYVDGT